MTRIERRKRSESSAYLRYRLGSYLFRHSNFRTRRYRTVAKTSLCSVSIRPAGKLSRVDEFFEGAVYEITICNNAQGIDPPDIGAPPFGDRFF